MKKNEDSTFKILLSGAKLSGNERLKSRILNQIEVENALKSNKALRQSSTKGNLTPFWMLYAVFPLAGVYFINTGFENAPILFMLLLTSIVCCAFWAITYIDDKRKMRKT